MRLFKQPSESNWKIKVSKIKVSLGFSGEIATNQWRKGDIELDELDLKRILEERAPARNPAD